MERAKPNCVYGRLEFEFDEQLVRCQLKKRKGVMKYVAFMKSAGIDLRSWKVFCRFCSQELSTQEECPHYDRIALPAES